MKLQISTILISVYVLVTPTLNGQERRDTFNLKSENTAGHLFVIHKFDLTQKINLYNDKRFAFESNSLAVILRFSSGRWEKINDSIIYLTTEKRTFDKVFKRDHRTRERNWYQFFDLLNCYLKISRFEDYVVVIR
jgi:hypothetical protein